VENDVTELDKVLDVDEVDEAHEVHGV